MIRFRHFAIAVLLLIVSTGGAFAYIPCNILNSSAPISENSCSLEVQDFDHADPLRRPIAELDGSGMLIRRFIWGRGIVAQVEADGTAHYFHHDGQGSTLALSDANSVTTDAWFYSPYGEVMSRTGSTETPYQWCGGVGVRRTANGLYFARHRYYHAGLKRWIARDPIGLAGGVNLYAYALNSPWLYYDPWGLCADQEKVGFLDWAQGGLDVGGTFEPTPFCDIINSLISVGRGNLGDAGLTILGVVPYVGDLGKVGKYGGKAIKYGKKAQKAAKYADKLKDLDNAIDNLDTIQDAQRMIRKGKLKGKIIDSTQKSQDIVKHKTGELWR